VEHILITTIIFGYEDHNLLLDDDGE